MPTGVYKRTKEYSEAMSKAKKGKPCPWNKGQNGFKKGHTYKNTGRTRFKKGVAPWNKGLNGFQKLIAIEKTG